MDSNIFKIQYDGENKVTFEWNTSKEEWRALQYEIDSFFQRENIKTQKNREYDRDVERKIIFIFWCREDARKCKNYLDNKFQKISK